MLELDDRVSQPENTAPHDEEAGTPHEDPEPERGDRAETDQAHERDSHEPDLAGLAESERLRHGFGGTARPTGGEYRIPAQFPDGGTTGFAASNYDGDDLEDVGDLKVTDDGAVIDAVRANSIAVHADDVTIRDSVIEGASLYALDAFRGGQRGLVVERVDIHQTDPCRKAIYAQNALLHQVNSWGGDTVAVLHSDVTVSDSFIHDTAEPGHPDCPQRHYDAVHTQGAQGLHIIGSTLLGPWQGQTSALIAQSNQSPLRDLRLDSSFLAGGTYSLYVRERNEGLPLDIQVTDNVWQADSWQNGATSLTRHDSWTWSGNHTTGGDEVE